MQATSRHPGNGAGKILRRWRTARGLTQFDLAARAGCSARHLSFIETGRSIPSRQAVLELSEALDVPLRECNRLLEAAGHAAEFRSTPLASSDMTAIRGVLQFILDRHLPYPAVILDRHSNCIQGNGGSRRLLARFVDPALLPLYANHLRVVFHPSGLKRFIVNWPEVGRHLLQRAEREFGGEADAEGTALLEELRGYAADISFVPPHPLEPADLLLPIHIRQGAFELRLFSTIMSLGSPQDITLQELRIESFFPADARSERAWAELAATDDDALMR